MAKIVAEFDTVSKSFTVARDGKKLKNVKEFTVRPNYEYNSESSKYEEKDMACNLAMMEEDEEAGTRQVTYLSASEQLDLPKHKEMPEFTVTLAKDMSVSSVSDYIGGFIS